MTDEKKKVECGLVMPISAIDGCSAEHWQEVRSILVDAVKSINKLDIEIKMVSEADEVGVIQKRIVQSLYNSDIVVCDVSCKNPNVMFELGMRLAFDKPTVIVKDDKTDYTFDTGIIEHIVYPRDLRFSKIIEFKEKFSRKVLATYEQANNPNHSTFLKSFGQFKVARIDETEVPANQFIISALQDIQADISALKRINKNKNVNVIDLKLVTTVYSRIYDYTTEHNITNSSGLVKNWELYDYIQGKINGPQYFDSFDEFITFIDQCSLLFFDNQMPKSD